MAKQTYTAGQVLTASSMSALQANDYNQTVSTKTASYVLVAADVGTRIVMNSTTDATITVNASLFAAGDTLWIHDIGAGNCTIVAGTCTVTTSSSLVIPTNGGGYLYFTSASSAIFFATGNINQTLPTSNRNKIINGDFKIWQRGTSFTSPSFADYTADRWRNNNYNVAPTTYSISRQTFTPGAAPVAGYEGEFFYRSTITTVGSNTEYDTCFQRIEDVRTLAGQTVTLSFWAKSDSTRTTRATVEQNFGSGGSANASGLSFTDGAFTTTTSWQRFTFSFTLPSLSGKTIGTSSYVFLGFRQASASGSVLDIWGVQLEAGAVATPFEIEDISTTLAKCQRYFVKTFSQGVTPASALTAEGALWQGKSYAASVNTYFVTWHFPVEMRAAPTTVTTYSPFSAGSGWYDEAGAIITATPGSIGTRGLYIANSAASAANRYAVIHATASAEL